VRAARAEAERLVVELRDEVASTRRQLERETITAPSLDAAVARAETTLERLPEGAPVAAPVTTAAAPRTWRVGERARSRNGGWEGRIAALEKGGRRASLEAGGMRISVPVEDLEPALGGAAPSSGSAGSGGSPGSSSGGSSASALQLARSRSVASSLDLRGARVDEALEALSRYLDDAGLAGLDRVTIIHGMGTGALRDAVRSEAGAHPLVTETRPGERGEGGDGATIVSLG
jgi:DNA mismatch repair protein MutS2